MKEVQQSLPEDSSMPPFPSGGIENQDNPESNQLLSSDGSDDSSNSSTCEDFHQTPKQATRDLVPLEVNQGPTNSTNIGTEGAGLASKQIQQKHTEPQQQKHREDREEKNADERDVSLTGDQNIGERLSVVRRGDDEGGKEGKSNVEERGAPSYMSGDEHQTTQGSQDTKESQNNQESEGNRRSKEGQQSQGSRQIQETKGSQEHRQNQGSQRAEESPLSKTTLPDSLSTSSGKDASDEATKSAHVRDSNQDTAKASALDSHLSAASNTPLSSRDIGAKSAKKDAEDRGLTSSSDLPRPQTPAEVNAMLKILRESLQIAPNRPLPSPKHVSSTPTHLMAPPPPSTKASYVRSVPPTMSPPTAHQPTNPQFGGKGMILARKERARAFVQGVAAKGGTCVDVTAASTCVGEYSFSVGGDAVSRAHGALCSVFSVSASSSVSGRAKTAAGLAGVSVREKTAGNGTSVSGRAKTAGNGTGVSVSRIKETGGGSMSARRDQRGSDESKEKGRGVLQKNGNGSGQIGKNGRLLTGGQIVRNGQTCKSEEMRKAGPRKKSERTDKSGVSDQDDVEAQRKEDEQGDNLVEDEVGDGVVSEEKSAEHMEDIVQQEEKGHEVVKEQEGRNEEDRVQEGKGEHEVGKEHEGMNEEGQGMEEEGGSEDVGDREHKGGKEEGGGREEGQDEGVCHDDDDDDDDDERLVEHYVDTLSLEHDGGDGAEEGDSGQLNDAQRFRYAGKGRRTTPSLTALEVRQRKIRQSLAERQALRDEATRRHALEEKKMADELVEEDITNILTHLADRLRVF